LISAATDST
jgi:large repetitive protein